MRITFEVDFSPSGAVSISCPNLPHFQAHGRDLYEGMQNAARAFASRSIQHVFAHTADKDTPAPLVPLPRA